MLRPDAERGRCGAGRREGDPVADRHAKTLGDAGADDNTVAAIMAVTEGLEIAKLDARQAARIIAGPDHIHPGQIGRANREHLKHGFITLRRGQDLACHDRISALDAGQGLDFGEQPIDLVGRNFPCIDIDMRLKTEKLVEEFRAKTIHDRHDGNQAGHREGNPAKGDPRDQSDTAMLAPGPQIAEGEQEFIRAERACPADASPASRAASVIAEGPLRQPRHGVLRRQLMSFASAAHLEFDLAFFETPRPDDELVRQANQIGGREFGTGAVVGIVIERIETGLGECRIGGLASRVALGITDTHIDDADTEGSDALRPDTALLVMMRLDDRAEQTRHANAVRAHMDRARLTVLVLD